MVISCEIKAFKIPPGIKTPPPQKKPQLNENSFNNQLVVLVIRPLKISITLHFVKHSHIRWSSYVCLWVEFRHHISPLWIQFEWITSLFCYPSILFWYDCCPVPLYIIKEMKIRKCFLYSVSIRSPPYNTHCLKTLSVYCWSRYSNRSKYFKFVIN